MKRGNACGDQDVKRWGSRAGQGWPEERSEGFLEGRGRTAPFASAALERAAAARPGGSSAGAGFPQGSPLGL